ncbi:hypothetical protein NC652_000921 [Populus alba x Populus x berolinensis]|nr:hypothetical protein NC652_000921 [Populus alba x Populus x berolinensis]
MPAILLSLCLSLNKVGSGCSIPYLCSALSRLYAFDSLAELIRSSPFSGYKEDQVDGTTLGPKRHSTEPEQETICSQLHILVPMCPAQAKGLIQYHRRLSYSANCKLLVPYIRAWDQETKSQAPEGLSAPAREGP